MSDALNRFHSAANDVLVEVSEKLWPEAKITLVVYTPDSPKRDIVLKDRAVSPDEVVSSLRRRVLSLDGDNVYKRDLIASIAGTLAFGAQDRCPPPNGHWAEQFWDMGREAAATRQELVSALELVSSCLMNALAGRDVPAAKAGRAVATSAELLAKRQF